MSADSAYWSSVIGWLFLVANAGRLLAYFPQIVAAARCDSGARSVSILTWSYFAFAHSTALLYAIFVLHDTRSVWIFTGNLVVTLILVAIVCLKRRRHSHGGRWALPQRYRVTTARPEAAGAKRSAVTARWHRLVMIRPGESPLPEAAGGPGRTVLRFGLQAVSLRGTR